MTFVTRSGALILAGLALYWRRLPLLRAYRPSAPLASAARRFQSGVVNDYVTWIVIGLACLGGVFAVVIGLPGGPCAISGWDADRDRAWMDLDAQFPAGRACAAVKFEADLLVEPDPELLPLRDLGEGRPLCLPHGEPAEGPGPLDRIPGRHHP